MVDFLYVYGICCSLLAFEGVASNSFNDRNNDDSCAFHIGASRSEISTYYVMKPECSFSVAWNAYDCRIVNELMQYINILYGY